MKKKRIKNKPLIIIVILVLIIILLLGIFLFRNSLISILFGPEIKGECKIISGNSGENKIELVFLTNNVPESKVKEYSEFLINSEPFNENKEKFNFYYAGEAECEIISKEALFCYSKGLIKNSSICPNDYIVVLSNEEKNIRSSAYMNVLSININDNSNIILHEFGHSFSNLADEYVPSTIPWGSKNCDEKCENFEEYIDLKECFQGCSKGEYYRSSENSVMRSLKSSDYGELNNMLIKENLEKYE